MSNIQIKDNLGNKDLGNKKLLNEAMAQIQSLKSKVILPIAEELDAKSVEIQNLADKNFELTSLMQKLIAVLLLP